MALWLEELCVVAVQVGALVTCLSLLPMAVAMVPLHLAEMWQTSFKAVWHHLRASLLAFPFAVSVFPGASLLSLFPQCLAQCSDTTGVP